MKTVSKKGRVGAPGRPLEVPLSDDAARAIELDSATGTEEWRLRCSLCELISYFLRYPDADLVDVVSSGQWAETAEELVDAAGLSLDANWTDGVRSLLQESKPGRFFLSRLVPIPLISLATVRLKLTPLSWLTMQ